MPVVKSRPLKTLQGRDNKLHWFNLRWGLRTKIIAWFFIPTAAILVAVALVTFIAYQRVTEDLVVERDQEVTRLSAGQVATEVKSFADLLSSLARTADISSAIPALQRGALERATNRLVVFDGGVLILNQYGTLVAALPDRPELIGQDWANRDYFNQMVRAPKVIFSNIVSDGPQNSEVIAVAVPIHGGEGEFLGAMVGMFRIGATSVSAFYGGIVKQRIGESGNTYIVDQNGHVIYHVDSKRIGEDFSNQYVVQRLLSGGSGAVRTLDVDNQDIVAGYASIPGTPWGLVAEERWATLTSTSRGYGEFLLVLLAMGVVIPVLVVIFGMQRIMQPIDGLIHAAQEVAQGNFAQAIPAHTGDEIEELADQFNLMAEKLQESYTQLEQRVADRTRELAALNAIAAVVSRSLDLQKVLDGALEKTLQVMQIGAGGIYIWDEDTQSLKITAYHGFSEETVDRIDNLKFGEGISGRVLQNGEALVVRDIATDPRLTRALSQEDELHSVASIPLISRDTVLGTLFVATSRFRDFSGQDISLLVSIGQQVGVAVENSRLFAQVEQQIHELDALYRADEELLRHISLDQVLQALVDVAVDILRADKSSLLVWDTGQRELVVRAARGFSAESLPQMTFAPGEGVAGAVYQSGEMAIVEDVQIDSRVVTKITGPEGIRSFMHVPIKIDGQVFGVFNINYLQPRAFGKVEQRLFIALTQRASLAIENAQLYEQAQYAATLEERQRLARELHDAVTQTLFSASLIAEVLPVLWERKPEEGRKRLEELRQLTRGALAEMRSLLLELRPSALVEAEINELFRHLVDAFTGRTRVPVHLALEGVCVLPSDVKIVLYRIAQEALNNIVKHANATQVWVAVRCHDNLIELSIRDDGRGFDQDNVSPEHLGLGIMRERAERIGASVEVISEIGLGTQVTFKVNLTDE
jgi:nitrate/nitrite-specific signal transduction histidine kinase